MWRQNILCKACNRFICTEECGKDNEIRVIQGSYGNGVYIGAEDSFYCNECAAELFNISE